MIHLRRKSVSKMGMLFRIALVSGLAGELFAQQDISPAVLQQIAEITSIKQSFTAAQQKIDADLVFSAMAARNQLANASLVSIVSALGASDINASVTVDIHGASTPALLNAIASAGGNGAIIGLGDDPGHVAAWFTGGRRAEFRCEEYPESRPGTHERTLFGTAPQLAHPCETGLDRRAQRG